MSKILIVSIFLTLPWKKNDLFVTSCEDFTAKAEFAIDSPSKEVKIVTERGVSPIKYIFYHESGEIVSKDWQKSSVIGLKKGKYYCTVVDASNCRKTVEFEIF